MKKLLLVLLAAAVMMTPAVAQADTVAVGDIIKVDLGTSRYGNGGEFILSDLTNPAIPATFPTFCLEANEFLSIGANLTVIGINTYAYYGGTGGSVGNQDPLDERTAFIYTMYRGLNPYGWTGSEVQQAIWWIEEERTSDGAPTAPLWVTNGTLAGYMTDYGWQGLGQVRALNIYYDGQLGGGQDLLTLVPVPDGGMTLMLLGGALMGLGALRRKLQ